MTTKTEALETPHRAALSRGTLNLVAALAMAALVGGCASPQRGAEGPVLSPAEGRALIADALPPNTAERNAWATDIYAAFSAMGLPVTPANVCAVVAVTDQESNFRADPAVPNLPAIAWQQIDKQAQNIGVPALVVRTALRVDSPNGKSYAERIDRVKTERELSEIYEDLIGTLPLGKRLFARWNPVRTGGPMQVSIAFAEQHATDKSYPYPAPQGIRHEVFTRRGGMYFGIAHLLDYPAPYEQMVHRFADFNAGHYASRNAALQNAISQASGIPLVLDGDLVRHDADDGKPGNTELAARALAERLDMSHAAIRRDLERGNEPDLEKSRLYQRVFEVADKLEGRRLPRAVIPRIQLESPKITRKLTTEWFAKRVDERHRRCLDRLKASAEG